MGSELDGYILNQYNKPIRCEKCGGEMIYKGVGEYRCERCKRLEYDDYGKVRNYLEEHRGATTAEISTETGVNQKDINAMLREERFYVSTDSRAFIACEGCGVTIRTGRYCITCAKLMEAAESKRRKEEEQKLKNKVFTEIGEELKASKNEKKL